jgi:branched-chain amino acid aminotransferase
LTAENSVVNLKKMAYTDSEIRGDYFIINGKEKPAGLFDGGILLSGVSFYEVMRVKEKTPLFLEDHLDRLAASLLAGGVKAGLQSGMITKCLRLLITANESVNEGNIRLILHYPPGKDENPEVFCHYTFHYYPSAEEYTSGVSLVPLYIQRPRVHAKIIDYGFRKAVISKIKEANAFEALLVNAEGFITEGSKSNVFLIGNDKVVTPPAAYVLPGITRKYILYLCRLAGISAMEENIPCSEAGNFDSCFITGTSPGILAVSNIDKVRYNAGHHLLKRLSADYKTLVSEYINKHKFE